MTLAILLYSEFLVTLFNPSYYHSFSNFSLGVNQFADLTNDEYRAAYVGGATRLDRAVSSSDDDLE